MYISKRSGMDHTVLSANAPCLPFFPKCSPDGATSNWSRRHPITAYYSSIDPKRLKGWVSLVGWPIADGLFTHISGHSSATGRAQDGTFAGQRLTFYHCATKQTRSRAAECHNMSQNRRAKLSFGLFWKWKWRTEVKGNWLI